ncbi:RNA ligase RtcB family protein [Actibacterium sp. 188UL27-1]|uniref:RNA ligase RtcB family protein n=1 Tax=Actibacterium sp. 188UL27-1 TaxID=2786961 RepID=UPI00195AA4C0|nr:RNA ligase RtcB family protein [Actibacterium sp. 188UL27-1]MBM7066229.1 RNA ligase RtcB family protein [Actibacterium sp. 188UL27-1]
MGNSVMDVAADMAAISKFYSPGAWIEGRAEDQLNHVAGWPGMRRIAAFPDLHPGRYGPVGAAFLADRIYPQLIGPDIGCGMALFELDLPLRRLKLDKAARRLRVLEDPADHMAEVLTEAGLPQDWATALGTIGGGNHFCELQVVETSATTSLAEGTLCVMVHSGSRGMGAAIFNRLEGRWNAGFDPAGPEAVQYLALHDQATRWAALNRQMIAERAAIALGAQASRLADAPHNHLSRYGHQWLHRKGAAAVVEPLVPLAGSRDSHSYVLSPRAGADALDSLAHGAGRRYDRSSMHGRVRCKKSDMARMSRNPFGGRIICEDRDLLVEEAGTAYKSAKAVVQDLDQFGLARIAAVMRPVLTYKKAVR